MGVGLGVRDRDRVRGAGDLDRAVRAGALGHVVLELGGDDAVLLADQEPRRHVLPQRVVAGRFGERLLGGGTLRRGHQCGLRRGDVLAEDVVEAVRSDVEVGRSVAPRHRPRGLLAEPAAREHARKLEAVFTGLRGEAVDVDEPDDFAGVGRDVGDHRAAVGVGGEHDGSVDRADHVGDGLRRLRRGPAAGWRRRSPGVRRPPAGR